MQIRTSVELCNSGLVFFFFSSRRRHTRFDCDWSSDVCSSDLTATFADFATVVDAKLPWFILTIVGLSFLLLVGAFRSLLIPGTAAVLTRLSAAAPFGALTAFFQLSPATGGFGLGKAWPAPAVPAR